MGIYYKILPALTITLLYYGQALPGEPEQFDRNPRALALEIKALITSNVALGPDTYFEVSLESPRGADQITLIALLKAIINRKPEDVTQACKDDTAIVNVNLTSKPRAKKKVTSLGFDDNWSCLTPTPKSVDSNYEDEAPSQRKIFGAVPCLDNGIETPLTLAIMIGNKEAVEILLEHGTKQDEGNLTLALICALTEYTQPYFDNARLLLERGFPLSPPSHFLLREPFELQTKNQIKKTTLAEILMPNALNRAIILADQSILGKDQDLAARYKNTVKDILSIYHEQPDLRPQRVTPVKYPLINGEHYVIIEDYKPALSRSVNYKDKTSRNTPLHWAAVRGNRDALNMLLDYGAQATAKNDKQITPFELAAKTNSLKKLLPDDLFQAIAVRDNVLAKTLLEKLVKHEAQLMVQKQPKESFITRYFNKSSSPDNLAQKSASVMGHRDSHDNTLLHWAVVCENEEITQELTKSHSLLSVMTNHAGLNALQLAEQRSNQAIIALIQEVQADPV